MPVADIGDTKLHYEIVGSGPPVLLIAGTGYPGATWMPEALDVLTASFTVITYDHRGTGASPGTDDDYSTRLFARDALALLDQLDLDGPAHIVGHSMGGRVAQWVAHDGPEHVRSLVLAASGPGPRGGTRHLSNGIPVRTVVRLVQLGYEGYVRALQRETFFTDDFAQRSGDVVQWLGDAFWQNRPSLEDYLKHVVARQSHDAAAVLGSLRRPVMVVVGELDTHEGGTGSHLEQSRYLAEHIPGAVLRIVPGVTHGLLWEKPAETMGLIAGWMGAVKR